MQRPNIVQIFEVGEFQGRPYIALEFLEGGTLGQRLAGMPMPSSEAARLVETLARAVQHAHAAGIIHRDLKPANILLGRDGVSKITDFGLAKVLAQEETQTRTGAVVGTPSYMAPEQAAGRTKEIGPAVDVYALGAILYETLTGRPPFRGETAVETVQQVQHEEPVNPERLRPGLARDLNTICLKCLRKDRGQRYASAADLAEDLRRFLAGEPIRARPAGLAERAAKWARRKPVAAALAGVSTLAFVVFVAGLVASNVAIKHQRDQKEEARAEAEERRIEAEKERNIAVAVNDLLQTALLGQADVANQPFLGEKVDRNPNITVVELLDRAAKEIDGKFKDQPETEAAIRRTIGKAYQGLGKYELAQPHLERSLAVLEKGLGADHPDTLISKGNLAVLFQAQGKYDQAESLLLEALGQQKRQLGSDHPHTLTSKNDLAVLYQAQGKHDQAESLFLEVVGQREKTLGLDHHFTLINKANLATLYQDQGKHDQAEPLLREVVGQREKTLGPDHPETLNSKNDLAGLYWHRAMYDKAESLLLEVLKQSEMKLRTDHPRTLLARNNLAALYQAMRKYDQAEPLLLEALSQQEKQLGADHPHTLTSKGNLAALYRSRGKYEQAESLLLAVLDLLEKKLGPDHPDTLSFKNNLAVVYQEQKKYDKAEPLVLEVLGLRQKKLAPDHPDTLNSKHNLASHYHGQGKYAKAEPLFLEVLGQRRKKLGPDHPDTLHSMNRLAVLYRDQSKYDKAEPLFEQALSGATKTLGFPHPDTQSFFRNLVDLYGRWDKPEKARPLLQQRLDFLKAKAGTAPTVTADAMAQLGSNLLRQKKYAESEKLLRDCLGIRVKTQPDLWTTFNTRSLLGEALAGQKKFAEAEPLLVQGCEGMAKLAAKIPLQFRPVRLKEALERLVRLYDATANKDEAARWRTKLDEAKKPAAKDGAKK